MRLAMINIGWFAKPWFAAYSPDSMIQSRTLRTAARLLLGTLIAAYVMVSLHAGARAPQAIGEPTHAQQAIAASAAPAAGEEHCHEQATDTTALQCKYHCQSAVQTLDHPDVRVPAACDGAFLLVAAVDGQGGHGAMLPPATRPQAMHHGGAPPLYQSTARLRI